MRNQLHCELMVRKYCFLVLSDWSKDRGHVDDVDFHQVMKVSDARAFQVGRVCRCDLLRGVCVVDECDDLKELHHVEKFVRLNASEDH